MERINPHRESTKSDDKSDDADLDALLAQARWPEPSDASTRRLAAAWAGVSPARRGGRWRFVAGAAAAIAIMSGVVATLVLRTRPTIPAPPVAIAPDTPVELPHVAAPALYVADSRQPSVRERLAMCDVPRRRRTVKPDAQIKTATHALNTPDSLQTFLHQVANPQTRAAALASLDGMSNPPVEGLLNELSNRQAAIRYAAARALGRINGPATTSALLRLVEHDVRRREAVAALLCCTKDPDAAAFLAVARESGHLAGLVRSVETQLKLF